MYFSECGVFFIALISRNYDSYSLLSILFVLSPPPKCKVHKGINFIYLIQCCICRAPGSAHNGYSMNTYCVNKVIFNVKNHTRNAPFHYQALANVISSDCNLLSHPTSPSFSPFLLLALQISAQTFPWRGLPLDPSPN